MSTKYLKTLVTLWTRENGIDLKPVDENHVCGHGDCEIVHIEGYMCANKEVVLKPRADTVSKISKLYMCLKNRKPHWCGRTCDHQVKDESGYVCAISGVRSDNAVCDTWVPQYRISATSQEQKNPNALGMVKCDHNPKTVRSMNHVEYATNVVHKLMFSVTRMYQEQRKYADQKLEAERAVLRHVKRSHDRIFFTDIVRIYVNTIRARRIFFALVPKNVDPYVISKVYAKRVCALWRIVTQRTVLGQKSPNTFSFANFVCPGLYMMRRGLFVGGVEVIKADKFLNTLLPEANTLDYYEVSKSNFTQSKNNILRAFRESVDIHRINPKEFYSEAVNVVSFFAKLMQSRQRKR